MTDNHDERWEPRNWFSLFVSCFSAFFQWLLRQYFLLINMQEPRCSGVEMFSISAAAEGYEDNLVRSDEFIASGFNISNTGDVAKKRSLYSIVIKKKKETVVLLSIKKF